MNLIFRSLPQIPSGKMPFWNVKRAKNWHSELHISTFLAFQSRRTLFFGFVLGSYCRKRHDVTVMWPFEKIFHRTSIKTMGYCGLACVVWLKSCEFSKRKFSINCWQLQHDVPVTEIFEFNLHVNFLYFLWKWVNLLGIFTTYKKLRAFERNPSLWSSYLMPWRPIVYV